MLKIIFFIRTGKVNSNGECPIYSKVTYQGQTISISTRKSISKHRWSFTNNLRNPLKIEKEKVIKASLDRIAFQIENHFNQLVKNNSIIDLNNIKNHIVGKPSKENQEKSILKIFEVHNTEFKKKVEIGERADASLQKYGRSKDLIESFLNKKYGLKDINVDKMNGAFIYNLESYLKYESVYKGKVGIKNNSVVKYFKTFKTVCNFAIKLELISKNPFSKYDGKLQIKDAIYLTQDELNKIEEKAFGIDRLERVKDIFLFSCYTGYAPIDAENLKQDNLITNNDGDLWIVTDRVKTGIRANVPVLPTVKRIIDKYEGLQFGLIPKISNQKMNAYLKEIADICGIKKNLTWYVSRHTFATTITLGNGIKLENVSAMMGHSNIKQTQHYAKVLDSSVFEDMKKLKTKCTSSN
jgi:integrase